MSDERRDLFWSAALSRRFAFGFVLKEKKAAGKRRTPNQSDAGMYRRIDPGGLEVDSLFLGDFCRFCHFSGVSKHQMAI